MRPSAAGHAPPAATPRNLWRATPAIALTLAAVLLLAGLAVALLAARASVRQTERDLGVQGQILAATVTAALSFNDRTAAQQYVDALRASPEILQASIYDAGGALFASFARGATPPAHLPAAAGGSAGNRISVVSPVIEGARTLGEVYLQALTEPPWRRLARYAVVALLAVLAALVVGVLGIAHATLSRANAALSDRSDELASSNRALLRQIEERERAEAALRQAQKMEAIGQLTGGVAHDFNNLLQIILASLNMLRRRAATWNLPPQPARDCAKFLDAAMVGGQRAAALTRQLLAFARRQPLEPTRIEVNTLVGGMSDLLARTLGEIVAVQSVLAEGVWPTFADANQLENALLNLAVNARDAMPGGGTLTIETANAALDGLRPGAHDDLIPGQYVVVAVSDTGCGMTDEVRAQAFEPFFTTKDIGHGTGLGLSQVYGFVKQSGGHVKIYSEPGVGTTMKLYLPRLIDAGAALEEQAAAEPPVPRAESAETILVVEDEDQVRAFTVEMLGELGYSVLQACNGPAALHLLDGHPGVDLLFTDVGLPGGLNGRELADEAKRRRPELKVLFTSGYTRNAIVHGGRLDAGVALINKPFTYAGLAEKLRHVLTA